MKNWGDNVLRGCPAGENEPNLIREFLTGHDFAEPTGRAFAQDLRKAAEWFVATNREPFRVERVTVRDIADFRNHLRSERGQAVATINRLALRRSSPRSRSTGGPRSSAS